MIPYSPFVGALIGGVGNSVDELRSSKRYGYGLEQQYVAAQRGFMHGACYGVVAGFTAWVSLPIAPLWMATSAFTQVRVPNHDDDYHDLD